MNKKIVINVSYALFLCVIFCMIGCGEAPPPKNGHKPLNISIYLDLSDRLKRDTTRTQAERDSAIIMYLAHKIKERAEQQRILPCKDRIKVFFYPAPSDKKVAMLSEKLELDLSNTPAKEKRVRLNDFEKDFRESLSQIYNSTMSAKNWPGSDIWGFFNKNVDNYCLRKDSRNVLVILTDGYIYHEDNLRKEGNACSYIPETLSNPEHELLVNRKGLEDLEVLILEVNPKDPKLGDLMEKILLNWLNGMGVKNSYVGFTDQPSNTRLDIDNFFGF